MRSIESIYGEMLELYARNTGMEPRQGSDLSVRLYTMAAQVWSLYHQTEWLVRQCFPQTAQGEYLDRHAQMRGLKRKSAARAAGEVEFSTDLLPRTALTIPAGTVCMTAGLVRFETEQECRMEPGSTRVKTAVRAVEPGQSGNVDANTIALMAVAPTGVAACTNLNPCAGGAEEEDDESLRARVLDTFRRLPNGANAAYYEQEAMSFDQVAGAAVLPRPRGVGTVDVVVSGWDGMPSKALLEQLTAHFRASREIAVDVQVKAPRARNVTLTVRITPRAGWNSTQVCRQVEAELRRFFDGTRLGRSILLAQLGAVIYSCDGVENYTIQTPSADVKLERDELPVLNSLQVEVAH